MYKIFLVLFLSINIYALTPTQKKLNFDLQRYSYIGDLDRVKKALEDGADINNKNISDRMTPLLQAAFKNRQKLVKFLLSNGANKNDKSHSGRNILNYAVQNNELKFTKYLINKGVKIVTFDNDTKDILFTAVQDANYELVKYLLPMFNDLDKYYNINRENTHESIKTTLLITAIQNDNIDIAKLLVSSGADINQKNSRGESPLLTAMRNKYYDFAKELLALGADSSVVDIAGNTPLSYAIKASQEDIALEVLKNKNFNIKQYLDTSTFNSKPYIYEYYIHQVKDEGKMFNYLHMAARFGMSKVVQRLLDMGMKIDKTSKKETLALDAIGWAAWWGRLDTLKLLHKKGSSLYTVYKNYNPQGQYGLAYAAGASTKYTLLSLSIISQNKNEELIEYLLKQKDASIYATKDTSYFYSNILSYSSQSQADSIYHKVLQHLNKWNYPNKDELTSTFKYLKKIREPSSKHKAKDKSKIIDSLGSNFDKAIKNGDLAELNKIYLQDKNIIKKKPNAPAVALLYEQFHLLVPLLKMGFNPDETWHEDTLSSYATKKVKDKELLYKILKEIKSQGGDINQIIDLKYKYTMTPLLMHLLKEDKYDEEFVKKLLKLTSTLSEDKSDKIADYMLYRIYTTYSYTNFKYIISSPLLKNKVATLYEKSDLTNLILRIYKDSHTSNYRIESILEYVYWNSLHVDTATLLKEIKDNNIKKILRFYQ